MTEPSTPDPERRCPVCGSREQVTVTTMPDMPALCNAFGETSDGALAMPRGDIELVVCTACAMAHNAAFDPALAPYDSAYENSLHHSPRFQEFAVDLADRLAARYGTPGGTVVEIGSGGGDFLGMVASRGFARGVGLDPSLREARTAQVGDADVSFLPGTVETAPSDLVADLVVSRHVLEHVADPVALLRSARERLARPGAGLYVEVPDAGHMFGAPAVWDLIYEHVGYFTAPALATALRSAGWGEVVVGTAFGGQYLWAEAVAPAEPPPPPAPADADPLVALAERFGDVLRATIDRWVGFVADEVGAGRRVAVWGAGSKGVTFVNAVGVALAAVIDVNPRKHGRFVPGTGARVLAPSEVAGEVDTVIVMNPLYLDEIRRAGADAGIDARFVAVEG